MATYYISTSGCDKNDGLTPDTAWQTVKKMNDSVKCGDTVCLKCGDTFFGQIRAPKGNNTETPTVYTSYGEGTKPTVSQYKTARNDAWEDCGNGIWRIDLTDVTKFDGNVTELDTNVGFIKVDGAIKPCKYFEIEKLENQWDFYNDKQYVYLKSQENPAVLADDIKFACNIICMPFADHILVENIIFIGSGSHGISGKVNNASVRNCEFHELGGSELFMTLILAVFLLSLGIFTADAARLYKNYARFDLSSAYREIDPPYPPADADSSPIDEFAAKHPRAAATLGAFFSFPALVCYIAYTAAVFIDL